MSRAVLMKCWIGNFDGSRQGLVIANNQRVAAKVCGTSMRDFCHFWGQQVAWPRQTLKPLTLYTRPYGSFGEFTEGHCTT